MGWQHGSARGPRSRPSSLNEGQPGWVGNTGRGGAARKLEALRSTKASPGGLATPPESACDVGPAEALNEGQPGWVGNTLKLVGGRKRVIARSTKASPDGLATRMPPLYQEGRTLERSTKASPGGLATLLLSGCEWQIKCSALNEGQPGWVGNTRRDHE